MLDLIPVKKSHILYYSKVSLYYISKGEPQLYKKPEQKLDMKMLERNQYPQFYIIRADEAKFVQKLKTVWNMSYLKDVAAIGVDSARKVLNSIIKEALSGPVDDKISSLPEVIEIMMCDAKKGTGLIELLDAMKNNSMNIIHHSINVMAITANYCAFKKYNDDQTKNLTLCALLHDTGLARIDRSIVETKERLTDDEFQEYKTHPQKGYEMLKPYAEFDDNIRQAALCHHERMDGSGYARGTGDIPFEVRLIGLVDCYEGLKYHDKEFREDLTPFDALKIIKNDIVQGKYDRDIFMDLCSCLTK